VASRPDFFRRMKRGCKSPRIQVERIDGGDDDASCDADKNSEPLAIAANGLREKRAKGLEPSTSSLGTLIGTPPKLRFSSGNTAILAVAILLASRRTALRILSANSGIAKSNPVVYRFISTSWRNKEASPHSFGAGSDIAQSRRLPTLLVSDVHHPR
jgi:hypothetical protein